jgi:hypothetical protein
MATAKKRRRLDVAVQAEQWFSLYYALGPNRSLTLLIERGSKVGLKPRPALNTVKRWSVAYHWQERVANLDAETSRAQTAEQVRAVQRMNEDQAAIGAIGVQFAAFALERMLRQLRMAKECEACGLAPLDVGAQDVARVMEVFGKWQRLAMGEVTDRSEIAITIWNIIIMEITQLFLAVNIYEDADQRKREMTLGIDDIVGRHLAALAGK